MDMASSNGYSAVAPASLTRTVVRWAVLGAAGVIALFLALSHSMAASAAVPTTCYTIDMVTCVASGTAAINTNVGATYIPAPTNSGFPPNTLIRGPYFDANYGWVEVVTDSTGVVININASTGQRIFPFTTGFVGGFPAFVAGNVANVPFLNANICGGQFGCALFNNFNPCDVNLNCGAFPVGAAGVLPVGAAGVLPAGAVFVGGGTFFYMDNNACRGDGRAAFVVGRGYYCRNGDPLFGGVRFFEVSQPAAAPVAAPVTAAPVATTTTTVAAPAVVEQAPVVAAPANTATALTAPQATGGGNTHIMSAPNLPAPAPLFNRDDMG